MYSMLISVFRGNHPPAWREATHRTGARAQGGTGYDASDLGSIDAAVRAKPEAAYDYAELFAGLAGGGGDQAN